MPARSGNRSNQVQAAALALALGKTVAEAALAASVSERELYRWRQSPKFRRQVVKQRDQIVVEIVGRLCALGGKAAETLDMLMDDPAPRIRLGSAKCALEQLLRAHDLLTIQRRLEALEAALAEKKS